MVAVRCEGRRRRGRCQNDASVLRHIYGQSYFVCAVHAKTPRSRLSLDPPLDWEGVQRVYRLAHPRGT